MHMSSFVQVRKYFFFTALGVILAFFFFVTASAYAQTPTTVHYTGFESGLSPWTQDIQNDWQTSTESKTEGSYAANFDDPSSDSMLTSQNFVLSSVSNVTITFDWAIESGFNSGEYLAFDVSTNGGSSWTQMGILRGNVSGEEGVWKAASIQINSVSQVRVRFRGTVNCSFTCGGKDGFVDDLTITATSLAPDPPVLLAARQFCNGTTEMMELEYTLVSGATDYSGVGCSGSGCTPSAGLGNSTTNIIQSSTYQGSGTRGFAVRSYKAPYTSSNSNVLYYSMSNCPLAAPTPDNPTHHWTFDTDGSDTGSGGHITGALTNGATAGNSTAIAGAGSLLLDGSDDYVNIDDIQLEDSFTRISISLWFRASAVSGVQELYEEGGAINGFSIRLNGSTLEAATRNSSSQATVSKAGIFTNTWYFVMVTFDNGSLNMYVNGDSSPVDSTSTGYSTVSSHVDPAAIGRVSNDDSFGVTGGGNYFNGRIDDVRVYENVALTGSDAGTLFNEFGSGIILPLSNLQCTVDDASLTYGDLVSYTASVEDGGEPYVFDWSGDGDLSDPDVFQLVYSDNFSSGFGNWLNFPADDFEWTRLSGSTPTSSTGPAGDHTTGSGYYAYTESSSNYNKTSYLEGPRINFDAYSGEKLTFWYHMYGSAMGSLAFQVNTGSGWATLWSRSGNQGNQWNNETIDLSGLTGNGWLRFRGITGSSATSDMALDDITLEVSPIADFSPPAPPPPPPADPVTIFQHCSYGGYSASFDVGDYTLAELQAEGVLDNDISGLQIPSGYEAILYENDNFGGSAIIKTQDTSCLSADPFPGGGSWNDKLSSLRIQLASTLPDPWSNIDIGNPLAGSASYAGSSFTINGDGSDIYGSSDNFHFVYQLWAGDATITARVDSQQNTDSWAKAGVMIRETLGSGSRHAMTIITPSNGTRLQYRATTDGSSGSVGSGSSETAPYWLRLTRSGDTFTAYKSSNGTSWTQIGSVAISMNSTVYVGFPVTSHNASTVGEVVVSNPTVALGSGMNRFASSRIGLLFASLANIFR